MGDLNYEQLRDRVTAGRLDRHYFLRSEGEPFLLDEAIRLLTEAHLAETATAFDLDQVSGDDVETETLASLLATPPLLSANRVVVIRTAQRLSPSARTAVEAALERPAEGRVLVVAADVPARSRAKFYKVLAQRARVVRLRPPRESELPGWLVARARSVHDVNLEIEAAQRLAAGLGQRLGVLARELDKLVTYVSGRETITLEDVEAVAGAIPRVDRWGWVDTVMDRNFGAALNALPALVDGGESGVGLIISLGESLIRAGLAREGRDVLAEALKRDGSYGHLQWKVRIYEKQARKWSPTAIDDALTELLRADRLIKSGGLPDRIAVEEAVLRMAGSRAGVSESAG